MKKVRCRIAARQIVAGFFFVIPSQSIGSDKATIILKRESSYTVPSTEIWKIAEIPVENGPSADVEFKNARVYFGACDKNAVDQVLIGGDFGLSVFSTYNWCLYVQPESQLIVGQRRDISAEILKLQSEHNE